MSASSARSRRAGCRGESVRNCFPEVPECRWRRAVRRLLSSCSTNQDSLAGPSPDRARRASKCRRDRWVLRRLLHRAGHREWRRSGRALSIAFAGCDEKRYAARVHCHHARNSEASRLICPIRSLEHLLLRAELRGMADLAVFRQFSLRRRLARAVLIYYATTRREAERAQLRWSCPSRPVDRSRAPL